MGFIQSNFNMIFSVLSCAKPISVRGVMCDQFIKKILSVFQAPQQSS